MYSDISHRDATASNLDYEYITIRIMLAVFKLLGLAPFNVQRSTRWNLSKKVTWQGSPIIQFSSSSLGCAYNVSLIILTLCLLILTLPVSYKQVYPNKTSTATTIELTACILGYCLLFMAWLLHGFRQKTTVRLMNRLLGLDGVCLNLSNLPESCRSFVIFICIVNSIMETGLIYYSYIAYGFLISEYIMLGIPTIVSSWFVAQYVFTVKLIEIRFKALNRSLHDHYVPSHLDLPHRLSDEREFTLNRTSRSNIATLRRAHADLCEITSEISAFYSVPILLAIAHSCHGLIYSGYYIVASLVTVMEEFTYVLLLNSLLWLSCRFLPIVALTTCITHVVKEASKTGDVVLKLLTRSINNRNDRIELEQFSLELLHRKIQFTACGLFSLDCTLLLSIISMVVTYLIILIQFRLGSSTKVPKPGWQNTTHDEFMKC